MNAREAIVEAGRTRMTPVILTACATILGLIPLAVGLNIDFVTLFTELNPHLFFGGDSVAFWGPLSWTMIFGLGFATLITLILVPVMYILSAEVKVALKEYKIMFKNPLSFYRRIRRIEYVLSFLMLLVVDGIIAWLIASGKTSMVVVFIIVLIVFMSTVWFILAQGAKRCHDINRSGWWQLFLLGFIVSPFCFVLTPISPFAFMLLGVLFLLISITFILWISLTKGVVGENKYGSDPKSELKLDLQ